MDIMVLIIGGKYQGKHDFASEHFENARVIDIDELMLSEEGVQELNGKSPFGSDFDSDRKNIVIIAEENASGIVPADTALIQKREAYNRRLTAISKEADEVYRVFCGIGMKIK